LIGRYIYRGNYSINIFDTMKNMNGKLEFKMKGRFKTRTLNFWMHDEEFHVIDDSEIEFKKQVLNKMKNYRIDCDAVLQTKDVIFRDRYHNHVNLWMYVLSNRGKVFRVAEMAEIEVSPKIRGKGLGSWVNAQAELIAKENDCLYMTGELQEQGDLFGRKIFFKKNGYDMWREPESKFSGWVIKKSIV